MNTTESIGWERSAEQNSGSAADVPGFLTERRNKGVTPDVITQELIERGWDADNAARAALRSLRRTDHHALLYWSLTFSAGFAALATASALHLAMTPETDRSALALAIWITVALVATPLALVSGHFAKKVEQRSAHAIWSPTRRALPAHPYWPTGCAGSCKRRRSNPSPRKTEPAWPARRKAS